MPSQTVALTFTLDQSLVALALMSFGMLVGALLVVYGALLIRRRAGARLWRSTQLLARELAEWNEADATLTTAQATDLTQQFRTLRGWVIVGGGLGLLLATGVICALALAATGTLASLVAPGASILIVVMYQGGSLGMTLGYLVGSARMSKRPSTSPLYADLRRRRPSDYRAGWLAWAPAFVALAGVASLALLATRMSQVTLGSGATRWRFPSLAALGLVVLLSALIVLGSHLCMAWLARTQRTLLAGDTAAARGADDYWRALGTASILAYAWMASGALLEAVASFITVNTQSWADTPVEIAVTLHYLLGLGVFFVGLIILSLHGRLGGRLNGWRRRAPQGSPAEGELGGRAGA